MKKHDKKFVWRSLKEAEYPGPPFPVEFNAVKQMLFNLFIAAICLFTWIMPPYLGEDQIRLVVGIFFIEFFFVPLNAAMAIFLTDEEKSWKRIMPILFIGGIMGAAAGLHVYYFANWWPVTVLIPLMIDRVLTAFRGFKSRGDEAAAFWASILPVLPLYLGILVSHNLPLPRLSLPEEFDIYLPLVNLHFPAQCIMATGVVYFILTALFWAFDIWNCYSSWDVNPDI